MDRLSLRAAGPAAFLRLAVPIMAIAAAIWLPYQFWRLLFPAQPLWPGSPEGAIDLRFRADEVTRWFSGQPIYGALTSAVYPPAGLLILWPFLGWLPFAAVRCLWAAILLGSLVWLTRAVLDALPCRSPNERWFAILLPLSLYPAGASIGNGQLTIPAIACLLAALTRPPDRRSSLRDDLFTAGPFLLALVKPDVAAPFFWILLFGPRGFRPSILVAAGYTALTAAAFSLHGWRELAAYRDVILGRLLWGAGLQFGGLSVSFETGKAIILAAGLVALLLLGWWTYRHRHCDIWTLLGFTAIVARLGFYHHWYDDLLILFPIVALFRLARQDSAAPARKTLAALVLAATVMLMIAPGGLFLLPRSLVRLYVAAEIAAWTAAALLLWDHARLTRLPVSPPAPASTVPTLAVMTPRDRLIYLSWVIVWLFLLVLLSIQWFATAWNSGHMVLAALVYPLALRGAARTTFETYKAFHMRRPVHLPPEPSLRVAMVTTFVPGAEPLAMLESTLEAMTRVSYPHDNYVLDEGDHPDVRALCHRLGVFHFTRHGHPHLNESGSAGWFPARMKAGNLNAWLHTVGFDKYEFVTFLDPDHIPEPHFLHRTLGHFRDPLVGYVQAPQIYYNQDSNLIARGASELTYFYYGPYNMAAYGLGATIVDGCHTTLRIGTLRRLGGYSVHTGEDLMLTHRLLESGARGVYVPEVLARGLAPDSWRGFLRQQYQWAFVTADIKLWHFARHWRKVSPMARAILFLHGIGYLYSVSGPLEFLLLAVILLFWTLPPMGFWLLLSLAAVPVVGLGMGLWFQKFHVQPGVERGLFWRANLLDAARWPYILAGVVTGLAHRPIRRVVTPKGAAVPFSLRLFRAQIAVLFAMIVCFLLSLKRPDPALWPARVYAIGAAVVNALLLAFAHRIRPLPRVRFGPAPDTPPFPKHS